MHSNIKLVALKVALLPQIKRFLFLYKVPKAFRVQIKNELRYLGKFSTKELNALLSKQQQNVLDHVKDEKSEKECSFHQGLSTEMVNLLRKHKSDVETPSRLLHVIDEIFCVEGNE